jgi:hypothetical protein
LTINESREGKWCYWKKIGAGWVARFVRRVAGIAYLMGREGWYDCKVKKNKKLMWEKIGLSGFKLF